MGEVKRNLNMIDSIIHVLMIDEPTIVVRTVISDKRDYLMETQILNMSNPSRPVYLYRNTYDPFRMDIAEEVLKAIDNYAKKWK